MNEEQLTRLFRCLLPHVPMPRLLEAAAKGHRVAGGFRETIPEPAEAAAVGLLVDVALGQGPQRERPHFGG